MSNYKPYTQAEKEQFVSDLNNSRARHCHLIDRLIDGFASGALGAKDKKAADALNTMMEELYVLQNAKAPQGVRPATETPSLQFKVKVIG